MASTVYKWTHDDTTRLIYWRTRNAGIFSGRRLSAIKGYELFVNEIGLEGVVSPGFVKKKWENLKQKYVTLKRDSLENCLSGAAENWRWFSQMDEALGGRIPDIKPSCNMKMPAVFISTNQDEMVHSLEVTVEPQSPPPFPPPPRVKMEEALGGRIPDIKPSCNMKRPAVFISTNQDEMVHSLELTVEPQSPPPLPRPPPVKRQRTEATDVMLEFLTKQEERDQQRDIEWMQREELREREALEREEQRESEAVEREERREREAIAREARREREAIEREARREREAIEREARRDKEAREREDKREQEFRDREERRECEFRERQERMEKVCREREDRLLSVLDKLLNK